MQHPTLSLKLVAAISNEYEYLTRYLQTGHIEAHNGFVERAIKNFAIGRKNWLFSDSVSGAEASSMFYSFVVSAKINGFDPYEVLLKIFDLVPFAKTIEDYEQLADLIVPRSLPS